MKKDEQEGRSEMNASEIQSETVSLASDLKRIGVRTLELQDMLPGDKDYPREMHEGKICPTLEYELHGWLGLTAKDDIAEAEQHMRYAAELTDEEVRRTWEERRSDDEEATLYVAFRSLGMTPPEDLGRVDRAELAKTLRRRAEVLTRRSGSLLGIADSVELEDNERSDSGKR